MRSVAGLPKLGLKPEDVAEIPPKHLASLLAGLAALQGAVAARLADGAMAGETNGNGANTVADEMLTAEQAARRTGLSRRSLYARAAEPACRTVRPTCVGLSRVDRPAAGSGCATAATHSDRRTG